MSVQLLDKTRKINKLLHNNHSARVEFNDMCAVLSGILESNILVISRKGKVLGTGYYEGVEVISELVYDKVGGFVDEMLNERLLSVLSTKENVNLSTLGFTIENVKKFQALIAPVEIAGERLGTLFMYKSDSSYEIDDIILSEYGTTVVGLEMMRSVNEETAEESRKKKIVRSAIDTLSTSELDAIKSIFKELDGNEGTLVASKIAALEDGIAAMLTSSGQAANFFAVFNICEAGDHLIASSAIYGGTYNLFGVTMKKMGIDCTFVDPEISEEDLQKEFKPNTKCVFGETITNPTVRIFDIEKFAKVAHANGVPLIIDNTFATPIMCQPIQWGADIVTHSTTKYMDGHASCVGGAIVDSGNFNWLEHADKYPGLTTPDESYHGIVYAEKFGKLAYITKATSQLMRDLGSIQAPQNAYYLNLGLESLAVRMKAHCANALAVAKYLEANEDVAWVKYADLESDPHHELAKKYCPNGTCGVLSFGLKADRDQTEKFMDSLKLASIVTHVADAKTCLLHPASHTHRQMSEEQLKEAGVPAGLIRISCGLEDKKDLIADISAALDTI